MPILVSAGLSVGAAFADGVIESVKARNIQPLKDKIGSSRYDAIASATIGLLIKKGGISLPSGTTARQWFDAFLRVFVAGSVKGVGKVFYQLLTDNLEWGQDA